jgi:biotin carboxylase
VFCLDFLLDTDTHDVYLGEINPRISGASPPTNLITTIYSGCPLFLFHILEFMDVDWEIDTTEVQKRWQDLLAAAALAAVTGDFHRRRAAGGLPMIRRHISSPTATIHTLPEF